MVSQKWPGHTGVFRVGSPVKERRKMVAMKTIFRKGNKQRWVTLDKGFLENPALSLKAKGLLAYLLSLPNDWETHPTEIEEHSSDGIDSTRAAFGELERNEYIRHVVERDEKGKITRGIYYICELPTSL